MLTAYSGPWPCPTCGGQEPEPIGQEINEPPSYSDQTIALLSTLDEILRQTSCNTLSAMTEGRNTYSDGFAMGTVHMHTTFRDLIESEIPDFHNRVESAKSN